MGDYKRDYYECQCTTVLLLPCDDSSEVFTRHVQLEGTAGFFPVNATKGCKSACQGAGSPAHTLHITA